MCEHFALCRYEEIALEICNNILNTPCKYNSLIEGTSIQQHGLYSVDVYSNQRITEKEMTVESSLNIV